MTGSAETAAAKNVEEPLQDSEALAELSKRLGLLERVRHVCPVYPLTISYPALL